MADIFLKIEVSETMLPIKEEMHQEDVDDTVDDTCTSEDTLPVYLKEEEDVKMEIKEIIGKHFHIFLSLTFS